jgi:hypothetical protein
LSLAAAAAAAASPSGGSSSSGSGSSKDLPNEDLVEVRIDAVGLLAAVAQHPQAQLGLLLEPAVQELLLQQLAAFTALLHMDHTAQQQHPTGQASSSASSGSGSLQSNAQQQQQQQQARQSNKLRADLLAIPAFHQHGDIVQLLPGGQAYLDAAAAAASAQMGDQQNRVHVCMQQSLVIAKLLGRSMAGNQPSRGAPSTTTISQPLPGGALLLSAAAVRLVLELQLLAAGEVQRQRQRQRQRQQPASSADSDMQDKAADLLHHTNTLLGVQIRAAAAANRSCLPPEVLQQAGLQLLQALAAAVQQLQLCSPGDDDALSRAAAAWHPGLGAQLQLLWAAAASLPHSAAVATGETLPNVCCIDRTTQAAGCW